MQNKVIVAESSEATNTPGQCMKKPWGLAQQLAPPSVMVPSPLSATMKRVCSVRQKGVNKEVTWRESREAMRAREGSLPGKENYKAAPWPLLSFRIRCIFHSFFSWTQTLLTYRAFINNSCHPVDGFILLCSLMASSCVLVPSLLLWWLWGLGI